MAVFRVEKNKGYTVMSNHHLRNKELSLKAKGLLSQMLSLPEDWDYTLAGLSLINRESIDAIRTAVWELEKAGYITRRQGRDEKGKMTAIEYTIYEQPQPPALDCPVLENPTADKPILENPTPDNPTSENPTQLNKELLKTNLPKKEKLNTDVSSTHSIPFHSLNPSPLEDAAQPPERKRKEATDAYSVYEEIIKDNICSLCISLIKSGRRYALRRGLTCPARCCRLGRAFLLAFANPLPSLAPMDLLIGIAGAVLIRLIVYVKGKNAKKYRKGIEYGSARWGNCRRY